MIRSAGLGLLTAALACFGAASAAEPTWKPLDPQRTLVMDTTKGRVVIELRPDVAPQAVERVTTLSRRGFYDGLLWHRVIGWFVAQTGNPTNRDGSGSELENLRAEFTFRRARDTADAVVARPTGATLGFVGALPFQSQADSRFDKTSDGKVSAWGYYCKGVVGMGRGEDENSANSELFVMRAPHPHLNARYTAFGRVVAGQGAIDALAVGEPPAAPDRLLRVRLMADLPEAERPRLELMNPRGDAFARRVEAIRARRGADFSVCDVEVPSRPAR